MKPPTSALDRPTNTVNPVRSCNLFALTQIYCTNYNINNIIKFTEHVVIKLSLVIRATKLHHGQKTFDNII